MYYDPRTPTSQRTSAAQNLSASRHPTAFAPQNDVIYKEEVEINPESQQKLEKEFEAVRHHLQESHVTLSQRKRQLEEERDLNQRLRSASRGPGSDIKPQTFVSTSNFNPNFAQAQNENSQLERRVQELQAELKLKSGTGQGISSPSTDQTMENRLVDEQVKQILLMNQTLELKHKENLLQILQEENARLKNLLERPNLHSGQTQTVELMKEITVKNDRIRVLESEVTQLKLRSNSGAQESQELSSLRRDIKMRDESIRSLELNLASQKQSQANLTRDNQLLTKQILDLNDELDRMNIPKLKKDIDEYVRRIKFLETENGNLKRENTPMKEDLSFLEREVSGLKNDLKNLSRENTDLKRDVNEARLNTTAGKGNNAEISRLQSTVDSLSERNRHLETEVKNKEWEKQVLKERSLSPMMSPTRDQQTTKKRYTSIGEEREDGDLTDKQIMGEVSVEEMEKLEDRIKEFGSCNEDLNKLIHKLRSKLNGQGSSTNVVSSSVRVEEREYKSKDGERFQKLLNDFEYNIDSMGKTSKKGSVEMADLMKHLEMILNQNRRNEEMNMKQQIMFRNYSVMSEELMDLKEAYRLLQIKHNELVNVNLSYENQIEKLIAEIKNNKAYFNKLVEENEDVKKNEKSLMKEVAECKRLEGQTAAKWEDMRQKTNSLEKENSHLQDQLTNFKRDLSILKSSRQS
jgi:chromosome segregation ATPase